jgi:RNA polymerase sigma-70 factor, ECF subfamily
MELNNTQVLALLLQVAEKNETAFRQLYEAAAQRVHAFVLQRLHDPAAAAEVVSDTFYEVWRQPSRFRGEAKFTTWLLGIARHKLIDRLQHKAARREDQHDDITEHTEQLSGSSDDGFQAVAQRQRRDNVAHCLNQLPLAQRECLHLVFYQDLSLVEIAALQGAPEGTVKTRLFHARTKIKQCLQHMLRREGAPMLDPRTPPCPPGSRP